MKTALRRSVGILAVLALVGCMLTLHSGTARAETWSLVDSSGLNYAADKAAATPVMVEFDGKLFVAWKEAGASTSQIRVKKYENGSWTSADGNNSLNQNTAKNAEAPHLAVYNNGLYMTWAETNNSSQWQTRVKKYNGISWDSVDGNGADGLNKSTSANAKLPKLAVVGSDLYLMWQETANGSINQIRARKYGGGSSWTWVDGNGTTGLNKNSAYSAQYVSAQEFNNKLYAAWVESTSGSNQVRVKRYDGSSWAFVDGDAATGLNKDTSKNAATPVLAVYNNKLYLSWKEATSGKDQIRVARYDDPGWTFVDGNGANGLNVNTSANVFLPNLAVFGTDMYLIWHEAVSTPYQIRAKKYDGTSWTSVDGGGSYGINADRTKSANTAFLTVYNSKLYAAFAESNGTVDQVRVAEMGPSNTAPTATSVSVSGTAKVGETLTGSYTYGDAESDLENATTFKWYVANDSAGTSKTAINGATSSTYTLKATEVGKYIFFEVTPGAATGTTTGSTATSAATGPVVANAAPKATNVSVSGTAKVGETLTGTYSYSDAESDAESGTTFKWYAASDSAGTGKTAITGATSSSYVLTSSEVGKYIFFEVTPGAATGTTTGNAASSAATGPVVANAAPTATNVSIGGTAKVGETLTGAYTYGDTESDVENGTTFKWYTANDAIGMGKTAISGATSSSYVLTSSEVGKYIFFEVTPGAATGTTTGNAASSASTGPVVANAAPTATSVSISGTAKIGQTLTGTYNYSDAESDVESGTTFKWYAANDASGTGKTAIGGVTASTYVLTSSQTGKYIFFEVTPGAATGTTTGSAVSSAAVGPVQMPSNASLLNVTLEGINLSSGVSSNVYHYEAYVGFGFRQTAAAFQLSGNGANVLMSVYGNGGEQQGSPVTLSHMGKQTVDLNVGVTTIRFTIFTEDGAPKGEYTITVHRARDSGTSQPSTSTSNAANTSSPTTTAQNPNSSNLKVTITNPENGKTETSSTITKVIGSQLSLTAQLLGADGKSLGLDNIPMNASGSFHVPNVPAGTYKMVLNVVAPTGEKLAGRVAKLTIDAGGNATLDAELIDPYGIITDEITGQPVDGVKVTLRWSDTELNKSKNRKPGDLVVLPELPDFAPNKNHDPQTSTSGGQYGWMVFPDGDYYIVGEKDGYELFDSRNDQQSKQFGDDSYIRGGNIHVGITIVQYDFKVKPKVVASGEHRAYMEGYDDGSFRPNRGMTRAELATLLVRALPVTLNADAAPAFADVPANHWAAEAIQQAGERHWLTGYPDQQFKPEQTVTRAELAQVLVNIQGTTLAGNSFFPDTAGHWAVQAIAAMQKLGMVSGYEDGTFRPDQAVTRAEAAKLFNKLLERQPRSTSGSSTWNDVPTSHWGVADITEATVTHSFVRYSNGVEVTN